MFFNITFMRHGSFLKDMKTEKLSKSEYFILDFIESIESCRNMIGP